MSNELRARLVGRKVTVHIGRDPQHGCTVRLSDCPDYESERERRSACAELLEYVQTQRVAACFRMELTRAIGEKTMTMRGSLLAGVLATPAQICAAFDATFAKELAELEKTNVPK